MTVSSPSSRVVYIGNGSTTVFPFAFKVAQAADLSVVYSDATGTDIALSPAQYAASGFGQEVGGSVTYPLSGPPIASGTRLTLYRNVAVTQPTTLSNQGAMWPQVIETALDRLTYIAQKVTDTVSRALVISPTDSGSLNLLPNAAGRANSVLAFDGAGQPYAATLTGSLVSVATWLANNFLTVGTSQANARGALGAVGLTGDETIAGAKTFSGTINESRGADIASAGTINLTTATGNLIDVTGTTTITAITLAEGAERTVRFTGALTLTHGASLVLPGGATITTAAGDFAIFRGYAAGIVRCVGYSKAAGYPVKGALLQVVNLTTGAMATGTTQMVRDDTIPTSIEGDQYMSLSITPRCADSILRIVAHINYEMSANLVSIASLFQDSDTSAIAVVENWAGASTVMGQIAIDHYMVSGTTSSTTFKVRLGPFGPATVTFNGAGGVRTYGGKVNSFITITEYAP